MYSKYFSAGFEIISQFFWDLRVVLLSKENQI